jgi:hypothetical protein
VTHKYLEEPKQQAHEPPIPPELMHRVLPPDPGIPDVALVGDLSLTIGVLSILSTFVTARLFESSPLGIFVVGLVLGVASIWLAARDACSGQCTRTGNRRVRDRPRDHRDGVRGVRSSHHLDPQRRLDPLRRPGGWCYRVIP